jgi:hypothetical protein
MSAFGWIGVDLDGTLAVYDGWKGPRHIGEPVPVMIERVKAWLAEGQEVRIFTARVFGLRQGIEPEETKRIIEDWCLLHIGQVLKVTCEKDLGMIQLWDDRCVQVRINTGEAVTNEPRRCPCGAAIQYTQCANHHTLEVK